jgi:hypothetical protein
MQRSCGTEDVVNQLTMLGLVQAPAGGSAPGWQVAWMLVLLVAAVLAAVPVLRWWPRHDRPGA